MMECTSHDWNDKHESWRPRKYRYCLNCGQKARDFEHYIVWLTEDMEVDVVLDVGTGLKGAVARQYYQRIKGIKRGYACDVWKVKHLPSPWKRLKMDALDLLDVLQPNSVDVTQAFGFMEHLKKKDGFKFLDIAESLSRKLVVVSGAFTIHGGGDPAYKVKQDGNPYHYYHSTWSYDDFEPLGYTTSREHDSKNEGYGADVVAWKKL